jgi:uncharacterized membrane protein YcaP (DUF421 family)
MDSIIRAVVVYLILLAIFRIAGKRTLAQTTTFDLILMLIISEAIQQGMINGDDSLTNAVLIVIGLVGLDILMSVLKERSPLLDRLVEGTPLVLVEEGRQHPKYMKKERIDEYQILEAARARFGARTLDEVAYAVVEPNGDITIVMKENHA